MLAEAPFRDVFWRSYPILDLKGENVASASFLSCNDLFLSISLGEDFILSLSASLASFSAFFFSISVALVFSSYDRLNIFIKLNRIEITVNRTK